MELPEDEQPPARPRRRLLSAAAVVSLVALFAVLVILRPWGGAADGGRGARDQPFPPLISLPSNMNGDDSAKPAPESSTGASSKDEPETDRPGTTADPDPGGGGDDPDPDPGGGGDDDPNTAKVPDLTGVPVDDAPARLRAHGFDNSKGEAEMNWQGATCVVTEQSPKPGSVVDIGTLVTFHYIENYPPCLSEIANLIPDPAPALPAPVSRDRAAVAARTGGRRGHA